MEGLTVGRMIHVVLSADFEKSAGEHRAARISRIVDADKGIICAHVDLLPDDIGLDIEDPYGTILTRVHDTEPAWVSFGLSGYLIDVPYSEDKEHHSWHWIEQAKENMSEPPLPNGNAMPGHETTQIPLPSSEAHAGNDWWRYYPLTEEQRARHQQQWDDHHWDMVLGMENLVRTQGGGFGGGGGSWDSPCGDPRPFPMDIRFFVPPLERGYFSEAGKQHMLTQLDRFCADIRRLIEEC